MTQIQNVRIVASAAPSSIIIRSSCVGCRGCILPLVVVSGGLSQPRLVIELLLLVVAHVELVSYPCSIIVSSVHIKLLLALHCYSRVVTLSQGPVVHLIVVTCGKVHACRIIWISRTCQQGTSIIELLLFRCLDFIVK